MFPLLQLAHRVGTEILEKYRAEADPKIPKFHESSVTQNIESARAEKRRVADWERAPSRSGTSPRSKMTSINSKHIVIMMEIEDSDQILPGKNPYRHAEEYAPHPLDDIEVYLNEDQRKVVSRTDAPERHKTRGASP